MTIPLSVNRFEEAIEEILLLLDKELACADDILTILKEELQALIDMDMSALVALTKRKMQQLGCMQRLDSAVQEKIGAFLAHSGRGKESRVDSSREKIVDISTVANLLEDGKKEELRRKKDMLQYKRRAIADKNYINKRLVEDSLGYLNDAISLLTTRPEEPGYSNKQSGRKRASSPAFLSRAV